MVGDIERNQQAREIMEAVEETNSNGSPAATI
jgi:hypothetical protein